MKLSSARELEKFFQEGNYEEAYLYLKLFLHDNEEIKEIEEKQLILVKILIGFVSKMRFDDLNSLEGILKISVAMALEKSIRENITEETLERLLLWHKILAKYQCFSFLNKEIAEQFIAFAKTLFEREKYEHSKEFLRASISLSSKAKQIEEAMNLLRSGVVEELCIANKCLAVVIPIYHSKMTEYERISLTQCKRVLGARDIIFVTPTSLIIEEYIQEIPAARIVTLPDSCFQSIISYNRLMMSREFYEKFASYTYILLYQLDAFVFRDELEHFCGLGYDYIGAPWEAGRHVQVGPQKSNKVSCYVGNGGLSLRHVQHSLDILHFLGEKVKAWGGNEDIFWSFCGEVYKDKFRVAPVELAERFAFEETPRQSYEKLGRLPFGCHAWEKYDIEFVRSVFKEYGYYL